MNTNIDITNETANFDNWMLLQNDNKPKLEVEDSWSATSATSSTWFEPLETLLSSASSPSTTTDDQFSPYSSSSFPPVLVKEEELDNDHHVLFDTPATNTITKPILKKNRTTRKRLTAHQKQAHNKIEKRYRININTKIAKLQQIIPWVATEQTSFEVSGNNAKNSNGSTTTGNSTKLNKSMILEKAVDYILYLQNNERLHDMEVMRLRNELDTLKSQK
ncbi:hypothetical protein C6P45_004118 [Maudiozyma exigua]|uniref:BHLH domain-containing protein n=1 Tax=Maudiozyma exigua TaxID=34358 RepID=A0A9P6WGJ9_MAUEX|nr:hypothetical protein C6P45_004118 [Kazachstania exigua]